MPENTSINAIDKKVTNTKQQPIAGCLLAY